MSVDTAFVHRKFGPHYAKFVLKKPPLLGKQFHAAPKGKSIRVNNKPIAGIKFIPGSEIKKMVSYKQTIPLKQQQVPQYNEVILGSGRVKRKNNKILGSQVGKEEKTRNIL